MIIQCPQCQTKYTIDDSKVRPGVSKVRCSRCSHEFVASAEEVSAGQGEATEASAAAQGPSSSESELFQEFDESAAGEEPAEGKAPRKRIGALFLWFSILLLLAAIAVSAYLAFPQLRQLVPFSIGSVEQAQQEGLRQKQASPAGSVEDIALMDVRQYMVQNEKIGRILVIEGTAINQSETAKKMIKLKAVLYDEQGEPLREKEFLCGNTVSLFQLQVLSQSELESALGSKVGVLTNNSNLGPDQEVEFMTVFVNPDKGLTEFSLKVVQAVNVQSGS